jgi:AFG3 family protein
MSRLLQLRKAQLSSAALFKNGNVNVNTRSGKIITCKNINTSSSTTRQTRNFVQQQQQQQKKTRSIPNTILTPRNYNTSTNSTNSSTNHNRLLTLQYNNNNRKVVAEANDAFTIELLGWQVKVPKGFENFFPKNRKPPSSSSSSSSTSKKGSSSKKEAPSNDKNDVFSKIKSRKNSGGNKNRNSGGGSGNNGDDQNQVMSAAALLLLVLAARSMFEEDGNGNGREITWNDFYNHILEPDDVDRIVVINNKTARVFLKHNAQGVPFTTSSMSSPTSRPSSSTNPTSSSTSSRRKRRDDTTGGFDDDTVMDMGTTHSDEVTQSSSILDKVSSRASSRSMNQNNRQLTYHFHIGSVESFEEKLTKSQQELGISPRDYVPVQYANETNWAMEALKSAPALLMIGVMAYMMRGMGGMGAGGGGGRGGMGGIFQVGKSNAKKVNREDVNVTFKDVAGCQEAKKEIMEFVDFLQDSTRFTKLGAKIPKGALLSGPPGTGKTLLAKAVAGEAGVPFFSISGSDFIEMFVGVGPSRVRDLFKEARAEAPCIIFIDEIDAVGRKRGRGNMSGGNDERENTLNQLLVEMDGFMPSSGVVVLAGTNRADILDEALTRPGRFDRQIQVDRPDLQGRKEIFLVHLKGIELDGPSGDFAGRLAGLTPGFSGADIANICNEAAIVAARRKADSVTVEDFEKATDRIVGGLESNKLMSKEERSIVAHHEAGHAIAGWFLEHADPLLKVTIIPRSSGALGYAQYLPKEVFLRTEEQIMHIVCMALAGRAAEEVFFGKVTTGASDDLRRVTDLIYSTIQVYGMNSRVGQLAFPKDPNAMPGDKPYSDSTAEAMDEEAKKIVDAAYQRTLDLISEKKSEVEQVAQLLLEKETITHDDIIDLIGPRPYVNEAYQEYVSKKHLKQEEDVDTESEENEEKEEDDEEASSADGPGGLTPGLAFKA